MYLSYWEYKTWFNDVDFVIIGSGIVGLNCAITLRKNHPKSKIVVLEKGFLPAGASTKNAGFACFGSLSELIADLKVHPEQQVLNLVKNRYSGLQLLRKNLGDKTIGYKNFGGYELFLDQHQRQYEECIQEIDLINTFLNPVFKAPVFKTQKDTFHFKKTLRQIIFNPFEAQIDTGKMMQALIKLAQKKNITILNGVEVTSFSENTHSVDIHINNDITLKAKKLYIANNGFASKLLDIDVKPARAQVLITKPIKNLKIKGVFHLDQGYYYFRNIDNRLLFGGGRNLNFKKEETIKTGVTPQVQDRLEELLKTTILPDTPFEIDKRWSGIMGMGSQKTPIVKQISQNVYCAVRLGGMGVAMGSNIGKELAQL